MRDSVLTSMLQNDEGKFDSRKERVCAKVIQTLREALGLLVVFSL